MAVRRQSDGNPVGLPIRLKELRTFSFIPLAQQRGFYFPPAAGWSPSLSREGNVLHAFINQLSHACPLQEENIPLHTVPNSIGICRQQTKFATFTLSLQRGKCMACFSSYSFCILVFYTEEKVPHATVIPRL